MINQETANDIKTREAKYTAWRGDRNGIPTKEIPGYAPTNQERGELELFEFVTDKPDKYMLYIRESDKTAITWVGNKLGNVFFGTEFRDNFGGTRQSIDIIGVNGVKYHGWYFKSSGDYARIKSI